MGFRRKRKILEKGEALRQENRGYNEKTGKTVLQRSKEGAEDYRYFPEPDIPPMVFDKDYLTKLKDLKVKLPEEVKKGLCAKYGLSEPKVSVLFSKNLVDLLEEAVALGGDVKTLVNLLLNSVSARGVSAQELISLVKDSDVSASNVPKLEEIVIGVMNDNHAVVKQIRDGKKSAIEFLVGQVMRMIQGKADPNLIRELIK